MSAVYDEDTALARIEGLILPAPVTGEVSPHNGTAGAAGRPGKRV